MRAIALGRLTALRKEDGGVRGIVVGDMLRPNGCEDHGAASVQGGGRGHLFFPVCPHHQGWVRMRGPLQTLTDLDEDATIVSIDDIGAYDLISRQSMLDGLGAMENGEKLFFFMRSFYGAPSIYLWEDEMGTIHEIRQGEG